MRTSFHKVTAAFAVACLLLIPLHADAAITVSIDANPSPSAPDIQTERSVQLGDLFDVGVFLELTDNTTSLASYTFSVRYDKAKLRFVSGSDPNPPGFTFGGSDVLLTEVPGELYNDIDNIDASSFSGGVTGPTRLQVASLTFQAIGQDRQASFDIQPGAFGKTQNAFSTPAFQLIDPAGITFQPANIVVSAIPEPSSVFALAALTGTVVVTSRRRRRN